MPVPPGQLLLPTRCALTFKTVAFPEGWGEHGWHRLPACGSKPNYIVRVFRLQGNSIAEDNYGICNPGLPPSVPPDLQGEALFLPRRSGEVRWVLTAEKAQVGVDKTDFDFATLNPAESPESSFAPHRTGEPSGSSAPAARAFHTRGTDHTRETPSPHGSVAHHPPGRF